MGRAQAAPSNRLSVDDWIQAGFAILAEEGIKRLLCEGGPSFNYELISRQMADELFWTLSSRLVLAGDNSSIVHGKGKGFGLEEMPELKLISLYEENSQLFFRYRFSH